MRALFATNIWESLGQYYNSKRLAFNERLLISATIHTKMKETCENVIVQKWELCVLGLQFKRIRWFHHGVSTTVRGSP